MKHIAQMFSVIFVLVMCVPALAVNPDEILDDPLLELRARELSKGLRCLVCQNQSIDDSDAELARDLRVLVRERLLLGEADSEVMEYVVNRYGEFVLLKPVLGVHTLVLWVATPFVFIFGFIMLFLRLRKKETVPSSQLSAAEQSALAKLLETDDHANDKDRV